MSFGTASGHYVAGVELLNETRGLPDYRLQSNSEYRDDYPGSESVGAVRMLVSSGPVMVSRTGDAG